MGIVSAVRSWFSPKPAPAPKPAPTPQPQSKPSPFSPSKPSPFSPGGSASSGGTSSGGNKTGGGTSTGGTSSSGSSSSSGGKKTGGSSGGGGSSSSFTPATTSPFAPKNTYDVVTQTYTDAGGNKMSMTQANAVSKGATMTFGTGKISGGSSTTTTLIPKGSGGSYDVGTQTYTDAGGNKMSMTISNAVKLISPVSQAQVKKNIQEGIANDKKSWTAPSTINNLAGLNDYTFVRADTTSNTLSTPSYVRNDKMDSIKYKVNENDITLGDIWAGSPLTLRKSLWANIETNSGDITPEQANVVKEKIKKNVPGWAKIIPGVAVADMVLDWSDATKFARDSRVAGLNAGEESKYSIEASNKIDKGFSTEWTTDKVGNITTTNANLNAEVDVQNKKIEDLISKNTEYESSVGLFNERYGGKELDEGTYAQAKQEQANLESQRALLLEQKNAIDLTGEDILTRQDKLEKEFSHYESDIWQKEVDLQSVGYKEKRVKRVEVEGVSPWAEVKNLNIGQAYSNFDLKYTGGKLPGGKTSAEAKAWDKMMNEEITIGTTQSLETPNIPLAYKQIKAMKDSGASWWKVKAYEGAIVGEKGLELAELSWAGAELGAVDVMTRGTSWIGTNLVTKGGVQYGKYALIGVGGAMIGGTLYSRASSGGINFEKAGMSWSEGAGFGLAVGTAEISGFMLGASKGKLSPFKYQEAKLQDLDSPAQAGGIGFENPFSRTGKFHPIATWNEKGIGWGWGKKADMTWTSKGEAGVWYPTSKFQKGYAISQMKYNGLDTERAMLDLGLGIAQENVKTKVTKGVWDMDKVRVFTNIESANVKNAILNVEAQESANTRGFRGFWNALRGEGLQQNYGGASATGKGGFKNNINRPGELTSDVDKVYYDEASVNAQKYIDAIIKAGGNARVQPGSIGAVEVKTKVGWEKLYDLHGSDTPELMLEGSPWGIGQKNPVLSLEVSTGKTTPTSPAFNEYTGKLGGAFGVSVSQNGKVILTSEAKRMPKDIYDLSSEAVNWFGKGVDTSMESGTGKIAQLKRIINVNFGINVETGATTKAPNKIWVNTGIQPWAVAPGFEILPSERMKGNKIARDVFLPENPKMKNSMKVESATWDVFMPAKVKTSPDISKWTNEISRINIPSPSPMSKASWSAQTSWSDSVSPSPSLSISPSPSRSRSLSQSLSKSLSISQSPSKSWSISPSPSMSPSLSPSQSPSMSQSPYSWGEPGGIPNIDLWGWGGEEQKKQPQRAKNKKFYIPDFTAKTIGIEQKVSKAQLKKLLGKSFTGLEIRPGVWT